MLGYGSNGEITPVEGRVSFEHVKFGYEPNKLVIHDFSADVEPGQKVAIVGPTGAGKTTMVNLLMRFYEIAGGKISIDGIDTKSVPRWNVHDQFSMVLQDTWVFNGTVRENVAYAKEDVTDEQVVAACRAVGLDRYIRSLPNGYDTEVGELGDTLSGGEKQRIGIARAFLHDASMILLDEPTSNLDSLNEGIILKSLKESAEEKTIVLVSHRVSTMNVADVVYEMENGRIS